MDLLLGWAAFAGAVLLVCVVRSLLIGRIGWTRHAATRVAFGGPLVLSVILIVLAFADAAGTDGGGGLAGLVLPVFLIVALVIAGLGVALSKLIRGEFSSHCE